MANTTNEIEYDFTAFGKNLKALLDSRGMSAAELAEAVNITAATLSRYMSGYRSPEAKYVVTIAKFFNVSIDWLIGEAGDRYGFDPEASKLYDLFTKASPEDKKVVQLILSKYED